MTLAKRVRRYLRPHPRAGEFDERAARALLHPAARLVDVAPVVPPLNHQRPAKLGRAVGTLGEPQVFGDPANSRS